MSTYLVTGTAGFIGSKVTTLLLEEGHTVIGVDMLNDAYDVRLKEWRLAQIRGHAAYTYHRLDICDKAALEREIFQKNSIDGVINLAARAGVRQSVLNPSIYIQTNTMGTLNLLECCHKYGVPKFVLSSTSSLYGCHNPHPYIEHQDTSLPLSPYAASKKAAESLCYTYHYLYDIDITVFRYFTVYGPAGRPDMSLFRFTQWIAEGKPVTVFGDGQQSRDFTYVDDIARGTVAGLKHLGYEIINLGSDTPQVLMETLHLIESHLGKKAQITYKERHPADVTATWASIDKARTLLGWEPQYTMDKGIKELVQWYLTHREWAQHIITGV